MSFPSTLARMIPSTIVQDIVAFFGPGRPMYFVLYATLIIFFTYFYTAVTTNPVDLADNMKKYGGFIPGIRPGQRTSDYIYKVLTRITFAGALYLALVAITPEILIYRFAVPFAFGGTSLLIVIGVGMDTAQQIETHMLTRNYEGFMKKGKLKGKGF
ncbi:MAG: preprotein translocase subunit SecY [Nitrospiria bacterium]